jgi:hypothetical protein
MIVGRLTRVATILVVGFALYVGLRLVEHLNMVEAACSRASSHH